MLAKANHPISAKTNSINNQPKYCDLNENQAKVFDELNWWLHSDSENDNCAWSGAAGTGKTYLIAKFVKELKDTTLFITPTHKAKKVLSQALSSNGIQGEILTIAQSLGKQPVIDDDGKQVFVAGTGNKLGDKKLMVID